jgi:hypothetical protein
MVRMLAYPRHGYIGLDRLDGGTGRLTLEESEIVFAHKVIRVAPASEI